MTLTHARNVVTKMVLVQIKMDEELKAKIDSFVDVQVSIDHSYNRSKFIRDACREKLKFGDKHGKALESALKSFLEEKANDKDFQHFLISIATAGATKALKNENFNPAKALDGLDIGKLMDKLMLFGNEEE